MDPITQGLLGGVAAQATANKKNIGIATLAGFFGGVLADLDLIIRSRSDPLLSLEYHRHFSHALLFIPLGGLFAGFLYWLIRRRKYSWGALFWAALVGYATHGLLDANTSYGTVLFWPFSEQRIAWDLIHVVHPFFTLVLGIGLWGSYRLSKRWPALISLLLVLVLLGGGWLQRNRALEAQKILAQSRGQSWVRGRVFPTLGNWTLWRSLYESNGDIYIDGIRVVPFREARYWRGGSLPKVRLNEKLNAHRDPILKKDLKRYEWFTDGYWAWLNPEQSLIGDLRFSVSPTNIKPLWGIEILVSEEGTQVVKRNFRGSYREQLGPWWRMLWGRQPGSFRIE